MGEVAGAVRSLGDERRSLGRGAQLLRFDVPEHDPLDRARGVVAGLPASRRVAADDRPLDERTRLIGQAQRQGLIQEPAHRAADPLERLRGSGRGRPERIEVDMGAFADPGRDDPRCLELAVDVQEQRLAPVAAQLAGRRERRQAAAELLVDDPRAVSAEAVERQRHRKRERVGMRLAGQADLNLHAHQQRPMVTRAQPPRCVNSPLTDQSTTQQ